MGFEFVITCDVLREKAPGQRECDDAIEVLNNCIREVDKASLAAISQQLTPRDDISHEVRQHAQAAVRMFGIIRTLYWS